MKLFLSFLFISLLIGCKDKSNAIDNSKLPETVPVEAIVSIYPSALDSIFLAHGGLNNWKEQRTLEYILQKDDFSEKHTIDLKSRKDKIEFDDFSMGFDGKNVWLMDPEAEYTGDVIFLS